MGWNEKEKKGGEGGARPTCVIVDEIDGAANGGDTVRSSLLLSGEGDELIRTREGKQSFVKTLVKLVMEGSSNRKPTNRKNGTKGKKDRPLLRPIICICNDLYVYILSPLSSSCTGSLRWFGYRYAPVLRPLRPLAKIVRFQPPTNTMLTKRLRTICEVEQMKAENKHLTLLVETAEGDLRSCLNTLQVRPGSSSSTACVNS